MEYLNGGPLGLAPALPTKIRLDWKCLQDRNTLAYLTAESKTFYKIATRYRKISDDWMMV
jgi:hypothetical protein